MLRRNKQLELIHHFKKSRRTPCVRTWSCRSLGKIKGNKEDKNKRSIRKRLREINQRRYFRFTDDCRYSKDLYEVEKKFKPSIKRSKSEKTLKHKYKLDFRSTFLYLPGCKNMFKEIKIIEEEEQKQKNKELPEGYEYKNLK